MPIFKKYQEKKKKEEGRLAGVMIPQQIHSFMTLYCLSNEITKSLILRELIKTWYDEAKKENSISKIISILSNKVQREWDIRKKICEDVPDFEVFKQEIIVDLKNKEVDIKHISNILSYLKP